MSPQSHLKVIKMIGTKHFVVELMESTFDGSYFIITEVNNIKEKSVPLRELSTALSLFDIAVQELQLN